MTGPASPAWLFESAEFQGEFYRVSEMLSSAGADAKSSIVVVGASGGEGATTVALNLAYAFAAGKAKRTLLIDANLRKPSVHTLLDLPIEPGLVDWDLTGEPPYQKTTVSPNLSVLTAGAKNSSAPWEQASHILPGLFKSAQVSFDVLIWDAAPIALFPDALSLARDADGVLLVAESDQTPLSVLADAREQIDGVGGQVLGVVLNRKGRHLPKWLRK